MTSTFTSNYTKLLNTLEELNMPALRANISEYSAVAEPPDPLFRATSIPDGGAMHSAFESH